ncbi:hypothetical protein F5878DRAFT_61889 [Lentinula raphanica]|uniref:6-methylsalicylate decarboxylase n=1 Tax=Lentinula raphanica TaxID=153919 RepID=A0AA38PD74_9AGAR|nr:hypothetical protein F5880DRAFT_910441 [Lentinula raphanica]KAJ3840581.1 hypothetical protein F5878DRAFT_61889 [Lentinula raphanica]
MPRGRIDVHHHFFPAELAKKKLLDLSDIGFRSPKENFPWTPEVSLKFMDQTGIDTAILSFPALGSGSVGEGNRSLARDRNQEMARFRDNHPTRFGFFATMPFLRDIEGALKEIAYALDVLKADGIAISSSYGEGPDAKYVGHKMFEPIWAELHLRKAVVFLHGNQTPSTTPYPDPTLGIPIVEVPNETYKAASHLVVTGTKRKYPDVKIILSHMGGSTTFLSVRVAALSHYMGCPLTPEEILADFKSFYYDTALSAHETTLVTIQKFITSDRLLFGTDFPAADKGSISWYNQNLVEYFSNQKEMSEDVAYRNALKLFPRLQTLE